MNTILKNKIHPR